MQTKLEEKCTSTKYLPYEMSMAILDTANNLLKKVERFRLTQSASLYQVVKKLSPFHLLQHQISTDR